MEEERVNDYIGKTMLTYLIDIEIDRLVAVTQLPPFKAKK